MHPQDGLEQRYPPFYSFVFKILELVENGFNHCQLYIWHNVLSSFLNYFAKLGFLSIIQTGEHFFESKHNTKADQVVWRFINLYLIIEILGH
jgi:hypothetical protein